jgi:hypothetical protein
MNTCTTKCSSPEKNIPHPKVAGLFPISFDYEEGYGTNLKLRDFILADLDSQSVGLAL